MTVPTRQIRALHDDETITVYQAYRPEIGDAAAALGRFPDWYRRDRMTWIKPSFLWMMYRCGWAAKEGQERVLAVRLRRAGFDAAVRQAVPSHHDRDVYADQAQWQRALKRSPVRVQWDPERDLHLRPLAHRAIQIGLSGSAVDGYVDEWTVGITDVTALAHEIHALVTARDLAGAQRLLPAEQPYALGAQS
ncbi:DUF4291 domain-containing protein [Catellatospora vulcania]|uniref:DUF4291 domain-containing protein n=1 Tax=Catellatospora vulcania TaxID=1460450 RepID=UPI0012D382B5|nr:DUF4291 domain-containing protein [Catellatospora vulcania]